MSLKSRYGGDSVPQTINKARHVCSDGGLAVLESDRPRSRFTKSDPGVGLHPLPLCRGWRCIGEATCLRSANISLCLCVLPNRVDRDIGGQPLDEHSIFSVDLLREGVESSWCRYNVFIGSDVEQQTLDLQ